ncbi:MAG: LysM peptidoglycan-binding domain-containing protein, partial [Acidobacteriota bacterium]
IPPGAKSVTAAATTDTGDTTTDDSTETEAEPTETIPDAGDNCAQGTYTIVEGDYLGKVASKFDVTVEALNAANASTPGYSSFYVGLEIVIPAKSDC